MNRARKFGLQAKRFLVSGQHEPDKADLDIAGLRFQSKYLRNGYRTLYRELDKGVFGVILRSYNRKALVVIEFDHLLKLLAQQTPKL